MKMCFCILPLVGVLFMCWYFPVMISGDWNGTFQSDSFWSGLVAEIGTAPSCSLRYTAKKDISLRKYFKFSVPVFQWAESFTPSEWEKLQNDSPPYGWKGQTPHEVNGTLSLLWHPSNGRLFKRNASDHCVRCAVVGNGGILRGSRQGKAIDDHDYVFRVNGAIIKGFEKDVGSKTSFYGFTTNSMKNSLSTYEEDGFNMVPHDEGISYIFIPAEIRDYMMLASAIHGVPVPTGFDKDDWPSKYFGDESKVHQFKMLHPLFIQYVTQTFLNSPLMKDYKDIYMPSTGALMLLTALHTCDQVSAYGFITKNYNEFSDHYYDKEMKPLVFYANHDMEMEGLLWELLHSHRVLQLYQRYTKQI